MRKARIDGIFQNIHQADVPVGFIVPVFDRVPRRPNFAGIVPDRVRPIRSRRQRRRRRDGLKRRARLVNIDDRAVFEFIFRRQIKLVRIIGRPIRQRQNLARFRVHHDHHRARRMRFRHRAIQRLLREILHRLIDGEVHRFPHFAQVRRHRRFQNGIAARIREKPHHVDAPADIRFQRFFQPVQPVAVDPDESQDIRQKRVIRIRALALADETEALPALFLQKRFHRLRHLRLHRAREPDETRVGGKLLFQFRFLNLQKRRKRYGGFLRRHIEHPRVRVERFGQKRERERISVSIVNRAARREKLHRVRRLIHRHRQETVVAEHLDVKKADDERQTHGRQNRQQYHAAILHQMKDCFPSHPCLLTNCTAA